TNASWHSYADHPWLAEIPDGQGVALAVDEPIHGGAATLSTQSANPLAAYLKYRLNARFESMPEPFADAAWRGNLLHRALQALYQPLLGQDGMRIGLPADEDIPGAVETALRSLHAFTRLTPIQYRAEQKRLTRVLQDWLETERMRPPFRVIALEQELATELLGHPIQLRLDRADELAPVGDAATHDAPENPVLIIDYKSGKSDLGPWSKDRLGEVQLPLYACSWQGAGTVTGLALARVKYGDIDVQGVVADPDAAFGRVKTFGKSGAAIHKRFADWTEALQSWRESIEQIAGEYIRGEAGNCNFDPNNYDVAELTPLLRLEEGAEWLRQHGVPVSAESDDDGEDSDYQEGADS
ncbi:MAG TPA: PD-(D/E)XK nuclease family protein, partial [Xanthomonadales bacterium]|nr:PD-(D/E)XK nuclease family protein [Xanthomonadales bacterium]